MEGKKVHWGCMAGIRTPDYWFESQSAYFLTSGSK